MDWLDRYRENLKEHEATGTWTRERCILDHLLRHVDQMTAQLDQAKNDVLTERGLANKYKAERDAAEKKFQDHLEEEKGWTVPKANYYLTQKRIHDLEAALRSAKCTMRQASVGPMKEMLQSEARKIKSLLAQKKEVV